MEKNFIHCASKAANNEISKLVKDFSSQLDSKLESIFQEDDRNWANRVMNVAFKDKSLNFDSIDPVLKESLFVAARQAKLLAYLQGLETQRQLDRILQNPKKCLGRLISQNLIQKEI